MPRRTTPCQALTVGQLARRWGVSPDRVRRLVEGGHLAGAFTIPSARRYGATLKVPLDAVLRAESETWAVTPGKGRAGAGPRRRVDAGGPALRHFPGLAATPGRDAGSRTGVAG